MGEDDIRDEAQPEGADPDGGELQAAAELQTVAERASRVLVSPLERRVSFDAVHRRLFGEASRPPQGEQLGNYRLARKLGEGGMGEVFEAVHADTGERVALKTLTGATATHLYRFKREFRVLADITHPNLIRLGELHVARSGRAFFTMELVVGAPFVEWVRRGVRLGHAPDPERLEPALLQLVAGVHHLHLHGCIHRDLKPSNVLVTAEGRVVILDFGLVSEGAGASAGVTRDGQRIGTPAYMAPEQAMGRGVGPPVDYYAIGGMLHRCLTGRVPRRGGAIEKLMRQTGDRALSNAGPGLDAADVPAHLRELCESLLAREPSQRPDGPSVLAFLRDRDDAGPGPASPRRTVFVGREAELAELEGALASVVATRTPVVVHLSGQRGDGKSALCRAFRVGVRERGGVVLHGRCRERESVPYKGVDSLVDALFAHLRQLPADACEALRPPDADALAAVFPVLGLLWAQGVSSRLVSARARAGDRGHGVREAGWRALRSLLARIAAEAPTVVHIDDFQWADRASVRLLESLVAGEGAPAMLLLIAFDSQPDLDAVPSLRALHESGPLRHDAQALELGPLPVEEARALTRALLTDHDRGGEPPGAWAARAESVVVRSGGRPGPIADMIADMVRGERAEPTSVGVAALDELERDARCVLELVAVSGGPLAAAVVEQVCPHAGPALEALDDAGLLVRDHHAPAPGESGPTELRVEVASDAIREWALAGLEASRRVGLHARLGQALLERHGDQPDGDVVFAIADHLAAGTTRVGDLSRQQRRSRAGVQLRAGRRALATRARRAATRYLDRAHALLEPWLSGAAMGEDQALALEVTLARAECAASRTTKPADDAFSALLAWSLTDRDVARVVVAWLELLVRDGRWSDAFARGLEALARIGVRGPRHATGLRAAWALEQAVRAAWAVDVEAGGAVRSDPRLQLLAAVVRIAPAVDPGQAPWLAGRFATIAGRAGGHAELGPCLAHLGLGLLAAGRFDEARRLGRRARAAAGRSTIDQARRVYTDFIVDLAIGPGVRPFAEITPHLDSLCARARAHADSFVAARVGLSALALGFEAGRRLPDLLAGIADLEAEDPRLGSPELRHLAQSLRRQLRMFTEGRPPGATKGRGVPGVLADATRHQLGLLKITGAVMFLDYAVGWERAEIHDALHRRFAAATWTTPRHALLRVILLAERGRSRRLAGRGRRSLQRAAGRHLADARRWAVSCPENFGPHVAAIEGELAAMRDDDRQALGALQRAVSLAAAVDNAGIEGLAAQRLAVVARRLGRSIVAREAEAAAADAYQRWGAGALADAISSK